MPSLAAMPSAPLVTRLAATLALLAGLVLAGCGSLSISSPRANGTFPDPVSVTVSASADIEIGSLRATLGGRDVSSSFAFPGSGTRLMTARLAAPPGNHTLDISARLWNSLYRRYEPKAASVSFRSAPGGSLAMAVTPALATLLPGQPVSVQLSVVRGGAFAGDVRVRDEGGTASATIPAGQTQTTMTFGVPTTHPPGEYRRNFSGSGDLYDDSVFATAALSMRLGYAVGPFVRGPMAALTAGQSGLGPDNLTTVAVQNGPPGGRRFEARFTQPAAYLGPEIGFDPGTPSTGGAGFCARGSLGYVISGGSSDTVPHTVTLLRFDDPFARQVLPVPAAAPGQAVVTPTLLFSNRCDVVVAIGAHPAGTPALQAQVYDILRRRTLCTLPFAGPASALQAVLDAPAAGNQRLRLSAGAQLLDCSMF